MPVSNASALIASSSVARALGIIGDRWTLLVLRDAFQGAHRFEEFRRLTGAPRSTLSKRLEWLVKSGLLERVRYSGSPTRFEYHLTRCGLDLHGTTLVIWRWERDWAPRDAGIPRYLRHRSCGHAMQPEVTCAACRERIDMRDTTYRAAPGAVRTRTAVPRFRRLSSVTAANHRGANPSLVHTTDIIGDRWTPLVLSAPFFGLRRFDALQSALGIATNILTHRLGYLVQHRILERVRYSRRPPRFEYRLTRKGADLFPLALMLMRWGDRWFAPPSGPALQLFHRPCGKRLVAVVSCSHCHAEIGPHDVTFPPLAASGGEAARVRRSVSRRAARARGT